MIAFELALNGRTVRADVPPTTLLVDFIRQGCGLTGTHVGCDTAQCGACTVLVDGRPLKSCSVLALQVQGREVTTIEGLAPAGGPSHPMQDAFVACHGLQCGYCTPGMIMAGVGLLEHCPRPEETQIVEALDGNLCRCTGYVNIVKAVRHAAQAMAPDGSTAAADGAASGGAR